MLAYYYTPFKVLDSQGCNGRKTWKKCSKGRPSFAEKAIVAAKAAAADVARLSQEMLPSKTEDRRKNGKSKNHTAHNQSYKAHRNGIKKPKSHRHSSTKGVCWKKRTFLYLPMFAYYDIFAVHISLFYSFSSRLSMGL